MTAFDEWRIMQMHGYYARIRHSDRGIWIETAMRVMIDESTRDETYVAHLIFWDPQVGAL